MSNKTVLGFDFGLKYIGVAVGQQLTHTANSLTVIKARDGIPNWDDIQKLIDQWQPQLVVVGLPLNMDGTEQEMTAAARRFGNRVNGRFNVTVEW
jgi:putative Holliday junction resolvase